MAASAAEDGEPEAVLLARAQRALRLAPAQALSLAAESARRFPAGVLSQEREVIAIEALVRLGRMAEARDRAEAFARRFPRSAHVRRLATLVPGFALPAPASGP